MDRAKETTLERADFTLQLLMFVTADKERTVFVSCCPRNFKLEQTECVQTMKAPASLPISQLFLI